ncbi:MAG: hypothetical protein JSS30_06730 [Verrucomicrobia bacterium]|nr:hypothetical protein [Verrucomicrobiota bacterium]
MQVDKAGPSPLSSSAMNEIARPSASAPYQSSLTSLDRTSLKPASPLQVFFEDLCGFTLNFFFWPIHGSLIISHQILLIFMLPLVFPFLILEAVTRVFLTIFSICKCPRPEAIFGPTFNPQGPSDTETEHLKPYLRPRAAISEKQQLQLLHLLNTYFEFAQRYTVEENGKENRHFNALIKIDIDGVSQLFQHSPWRNRDLTSYIDFIVNNARPTSALRFTFIGLDYSYFIGMLKMKVKTDVVKFQLKDQQLQLQEQESGKPKSRFAAFKSYIFNLLSRYILREQIYDLQQENDQRTLDFSLWPGTTRRHCADLINNSLKGAHLSEYHISLLDIENIIRT